MPAYHRLDLSATLTPRKNKNRKWLGEWVFGIYNAYNRRNAASISFGQNQTTGVTEATRTSIFGIVPSLYNGNAYTATETLIAAPVINRIEQTIEGSDGDTEIQLQVFFDDPGDVENYYLGEFTPSNLPLPSLAAISDEFTDGNENYMENDNENYVAGVTVDINVYGISQRYYDYLNILIQQSGSDENGPFPTTPVQLKGNCTNVNDSNEEVLGYFRMVNLILHPIRLISNWKWIVVNGTRTVTKSVPLSRRTKEN